MPDSPAAERNKGPILERLRATLPDAGLVLEIGSGTGQHAVHFAAALPKLEWQPTEAETALVAAIAALAEAAGISNLRAPLMLDVLEHPWPVARADALFCANVIHIAPWAVTQALFEGASQVLPAGAPLVLYGPFRIGGWHTAPSNEAFDASLKARDPEWGVRDLDDVGSTAAACGFAFGGSFEMPANNLTVVFRRLSPDRS